MKNTKRGCSTCGGNQPTKRIVESFERFTNNRNLNEGLIDEVGGMSSQTRIDSAAIFIDELFASKDTESIISIIRKGIIQTLDSNVEEMGDLDMYDDLLDELEGEFGEVIHLLKTYVKDMRLFYENQ
jgi:hypothetical protein